MLDACVQTLVRNADDYLYLCIAAVAPYVKRVRIAFDTRSTDKTIFVIRNLMRDFKNVEMFFVTDIENPLVDLVEARNRLLNFQEEWGMIVDSDEFHYDFPSLLLGDADAYLCTCYAIWNATKIHRSSSRARIGRFFRNKPDLKWKGAFGKEQLFCGDNLVFKDVPVLPYKYIHFTHIKKDTWRSELNQKRVADGKNLSDTPQEIISIINNIHENLPFVPKYH